MKKLTKRQLPLYGFAGFGPNMLNLIVGTYLCDALMVEGFGANVENWTYLNKTLIVAGVWSVMILIAKIVDGVADIPLAAWTDSLKTKWGKRRPALLLGNILMITAFVFMLMPLTSEEHSMKNTIWFGLVLMVFYTFYTLTMVTYYGTFSEVTATSQDRVTLSNWKAGFDVVYFCLGYALIPMLIGNINIRLIALMFLPLVLTMLIPFFLLKERSTLPADVAQYKKDHPEDKAAQIEENVGIFDSLKYTIKNRDFIIWMVVMAALQFGLQMFLTGQNVYYSGAMGFAGWRIAVVNAAAFAPVPLTLILYNKIVRKRGFRFGYQYALGIFSIGMVLAAVAQKSIVPDDNTRFYLALAASTIASFGVGAFFSVTYTIPSQIAADEVRRTGKSHPSMYFAIQGLFSAVVTAISTGLVWINLKDSGHSNWMTTIVAISCIVSLILAFFLPRSLNDIGKDDEQ